MKLTLRYRPRTDGEKQKKNDNKNRASNVQLHLARPDKECHSWVSVQIITTVNQPENERRVAGKFQIETCHSSEQEGGGESRERQSGPCENSTHCESSRSLCSDGSNFTGTFS